MQTTKVFQAARPSNPRIKEGLEKETEPGGQKKPLSFTAKKRNSYPKSSEIKVNYKIYVQGFSCRHAAEPRIKKGLEKGMGPGGQKKSLSFENAKMNCTPLTAGSGAASLRRRGGYATGRMCSQGGTEGGGMLRGNCKTTFPSANFICKTAFPRARTEISIPSPQSQSRSLRV